MSSPLPGNAHPYGAPVPPKNSDDWPGQQGVAIRKLSLFSEILSPAFSMPWRQASVLLIWAVLVPAAATVITNQLMNISMLGSTSGTGFEARNPLSMVGFGLLGFLAILIYLFVVLVTAAFVPAFAAENIRSRFLGHRPSARQIWTGISRVMWRILGYSLLMGLIVGFGLGIVVFIFAMIFGVLFTIAAGGPAALLIGLILAAVVIAGFVFLIWFFTKLTFVPSVMVFEGATIMAAVSRSWQLTKGRVWRTFGTLFVVSLAFTAATGLIGLLMALVFFSGFESLAPMSASPLSTYDFSLASVLGDVITTPITALGALGTAIASTLLYLDARGKTERLDLTLENWQNGVSQGVPAQNMPYPFATPVAAPPAFAATQAPPAPPAPPASPTQGWQQP
ncbi:hypothetical protein G7068_14955 [Leucobacter viscericola]|uniref:DUF7847 domain-containing protein n=1 Tax=Leucobacter viscericola TaxID=2714935 RepID=A0A6G7XJ09_9MICO|nr:glycerophosphoryl diester phosphodiesterase membrane domain-containing protein [Leucobacter viscericola]QIK64358.1 hypothetical protein G7068_14955 [Leucobacter viscericola]